jgi:hypothetical protein
MGDQARRTNERSRHHLVSSPFVRPGVSYWMKSVSAAGIGFAIEAVLLK